MNNDKVEDIISGEVEDLCAKLREKLEGRRSKSSSGLITIIIDPFAGENPHKYETEVHVEIGGYDFEGMNRHHDIGTFRNFESAFRSLKNEIETAIPLGDEDG